MPWSLQRAGRGQARADAWRRDAGTPESQPPPWRRRVVSGARTRPGKTGARTRPGKLGTLRLSTGADPLGPACGPTRSRVRDVGAHPSSSGPACGLGPGLQEDRSPVRGEGSLVVQAWAFCLTKGT